MSTYEISKSSLLSLKAEIIRKQEEVKNKQYENVKRKVPLVIKNKGVENRSERDTVEDLDLLEKSRIALERKAKLYDKLSSSKKIDDDPASFPNRFLVRFKDKEKPDTNPTEDSDCEDIDKTDYADAENSDEEWVEYVDCLGRTRTCLKKDLEHFKSRDKDYKRNENEEPKEYIEEKEIVEEPPIENLKEPQLLSDDMRREMLRQQWEKEELELQDKDDIHYQDLLFNEARSHGVGYFGFSKDEEERRKQQESLEKLRNETLKEQKKAQELKAMRDQQLAARVKAAKMRKRARLGLPLEDDDEEPEIGPPPPETEPKPEVNEEDALKERLLEEARRKHVRPWDIGKEKVDKFYEYSQDEWVEKRRKERHDEFAPPTVYRREFRAPIADLNVAESSKTLRFSTKKPVVDQSTKISNINPYKKKSNEDLQDPFNEDTRTFNPYKPVKSTGKRTYETMSSDVYGASTSYDEETSEKGESCVITPNNIEASIEAGLRFLREQSEKGGSVNDFGNDDMFTA